MLEEHEWEIICDETEGVHTRCTSKMKVEGGWLYLFEKIVRNLVPENTKCSLEYDIFPKLSNKNAYGFVSGKELIDIGTPQRYELAQKYFCQKREIIPVKTAASRKLTPQQPMLQNYPDHKCRG